MIIDTIQVNKEEIIEEWVKNKSTFEILSLAYERMDTWIKNHGSHDNITLHAKQTRQEIWNSMLGIVYRVKKHYPQFFDDKDFGSVKYFDEIIDSVNDILANEG